MHSPRKHYFLGIIWFIVSLLVCETNDVITKYLERNLSPFQVVFGRFFFSTIVLLPVMGLFAENFKTCHLGINFLRGLILFFGMSIWCHGLDVSQLNVACLINFTTPIFTLLLASLILKEKIEKPRIIATLVGFLGVAVVLNPQTASFSVSSASLFLLSAIFFALLDILNKMLVTRESALTSLFYTGFFTMFFSMISLIFSHALKYDPPYLILSVILQKIIKIETHDLQLLCLLGVGANLLMFCILKSFSHIDVSATAPLRYVELILASTFGYLFFGESITPNMILGATIIIPSMIYLTSFEAKKSRKKNLSETRKLTHCC
ncbi:MAG: DMT family transporter [Puniceicoccales bacterium]|jgi:S-adenosylmethionine uptake transporter|nr:DMT family transporter [Puniceicoccales bacterium]